jgi:16S rRNA (guanine527-N7)-methyltransferase
VTRVWTDAAKRLRAGIAELEITVPEAAPDRLIAYLQELLRWNRAYNLTAVKDPLDMVARHLLDSLVVLPYLHGREVIDIGSGAGLPGIPLALADSSRRFTLLDSNGKKTAFLRHAVRHLRIENADVVEARAEAFGDDAGKARFDTVTSRAFAGLSDMLRVSAPLCAPGGRIVAMRGRIDRAELAGLAQTPGFALQPTVPLVVPGITGDRHLVIFSRP